MLIKHSTWLLSLIVILLVANPLYAQTNCGLPFELNTEGSKIIDQCGNPIKLKSVNWYGAHLAYGVVEGLDHQPLDTIVHLIKNRGFNSVRLVFSNENLHTTAMVEDKYLTANPALKGKTPLELLDIVIKALTDEGIIVILNNHNTRSIWCCGFDDNGLWYHPSQTTSQWINDWTTLATRYLNNPLVAGFDLRNEVRPECNGPNCENPNISWDTLKTLWGTMQPNWGSNNQNDWKLAATTAGNAIHSINPKGLIIVEGINWQGIPYPNPLHKLLPTSLHNRIFLMPVKTNPIILNHPHKLIYQAHVYAFTGPNQLMMGNKLTKGQPSYSELSPEVLKKTYDQSFGFVAQNQNTTYTAPVWIGEFGVASGEMSNKEWFSQTVDYLIANDLGWAYWPLNGSDDYGLLNPDWSDYRQDWRTPYIEKLLKN